MFLLASHLPICGESSQKKKTVCQGDAELMMQESLAEATGLERRALNGQIVTCRPSDRIHAAQQTLPYFIPQPRSLMAYLAVQAFHFIELIPPFAFVLQCARIFIYSQWNVYRGKRMPRHCHSAGDRAHT